MLGGLPLGAVLSEAKARAADAEPVPASTREDDEEAAERHAIQRAAREATWRARLPRRYAGATLATLRAQQQPQALAEWLSGGGLNLLLTGMSRRGKTYAVYALGNAYVEAGGHAIAYSLADLNAALRPDGDPTAYDRVTGVGLLVLDDIGREQVSAWTLEQLQRILDHRNREGLRTAMTTNLGHAALEERYGDPILQRILDDCVVRTIAGEKIGGAAW